MATGHLRKRTTKSGKTSYQIVIEGDRNPITGKRERTYKTVNGTKKQAEAKLMQMLLDAESTNVFAPSAMRLEDWMKQWLENYLPNIEETTRVGYKEKIREYIIPAMGKLPLKSIKNSNVQAWVNGLSKKGLSPKTIRNAYNNLNAALKKAVILRMIPYNPCEGTVLPKLKKHQINVYNDTEIRDALNAAKGTDMYLIILILVATGIRRGELCGLTWGDIDFSKNQIQIHNNRVNGDVGRVIEKAPKSEAGNRVISIGNDVMRELAKARMDYIKDRNEWGAGFDDTGYVIRHPNGKPYNPDSITQKWERFVKKHNLRPLKLHGLRHSNATSLINAGVDAKVVQQRMGHSDISVTYNTYVHVLPNMDEDAANKIDKILKIS